MLFCQIVWLFVHYEVVYFRTNRYKVGLHTIIMNYFIFKDFAHYFCQSIYTCILIEFKCFYQQKLSGIHNLFCNISFVKVSVNLCIEQCIVSWLDAQTVESVFFVQYLFSIMDLCFYSVIKQFLNAWNCILINKNTGIFSALLIPALSKEFGNTLNICCQ